VSDSKFTLLNVFGEPKKSDIMSSETTPITTCAASSEHIVRIERDYSLSDDKTRFIMTFPPNRNDPLPIECLLNMVNHINGIFEKAESINRWSVFENFLAWITGYLSYWFVESHYDKVR
jgi:hypothetical protein